MEGEEGGIPVRRTSRARKVNPRFVGDDIDENYMKMVGRITASDYSGKINDKDNMKEPTGDPSDDVLLPDGREGCNESSVKDSQNETKTFFNTKLTSGQNFITVLSSNKSTSKNNNDSGSVNIALKTVSLKRVKKNKNTDIGVNSSEVKFDPSKPSASIIVRCRSSTESEASEESLENEMEKKRKLNALEEEGNQIKKIKLNSESNSSERTDSKEKSEEEPSSSSSSSSVVSVQRSVSASFPSKDNETKNLNNQSDSSLSKDAFSSPMNISCKIGPSHSDTDIVFKNVFKKPFVSVCNRTDQNQPKIVLTTESRLNLPGKKLKIVSLKPITTLKENMTPQTQSTQNLENVGSELVLGKGGPVELKIIKKEVYPLSGSNLPRVVDKTVPDMGHKSKQFIKLSNSSNDTSTANLFSSDGEDDIPLNKLMKKQGVTKKKKKPSFKDLKIQKQKIKNNKIKKNMLKKKFSDQDDLPLKLLLKKSKSMVKGSADKVKSILHKTPESTSGESSVKKIKMKGMEALIQKRKIKTAIMKKKKQKVIAGEASEGNPQPVIKLEGKVKKLSKVKPKILESKVFSIKNKMNPFLNNKKLSKKGNKRLNKLRFKFPKKTNVKKDAPIATETTNIVISVSGIEGDYACLAIDKDHISTQSDVSEAPLKAKSDPLKIKMKKKRDTSFAPMKKYTFNSGLVLEEDVPVESLKSKSTGPKECKTSKKTKEKLEMKVVKEELFHESLKSKFIASKESKSKENLEMKVLENFPLESQLNRKPSLEMRIVTCKNENFKQHFAEARIKDEPENSSEKIFSHNSLAAASIDKPKFVKDESIRGAITEVDVCTNNNTVKDLDSLADTKPRFRNMDKVEVKLDSEHKKNRDREKHKEEKIKKSEKHGHSDKTKSDKDSRKYKDKHHKNDDKKERLSVEGKSLSIDGGKTEEKYIKKEKNESKVDPAPRRLEKETNKSDLNPKESKVEPGTKKEKESKDNPQTTTLSNKVKKKENFEEALLSVPMPKPSKHKSMDGLKSHDRKREKEEKKLSKEKRSESKDVKQELNDDAKHSRERSSSKESSKSKDGSDYVSKVDVSKIKSDSHGKDIKKEEKPRHKDERRHGSKSEEKIKSNHDHKEGVKSDLDSSLSFEKDRKRKKEERERSRHSSHKKHKREHSESHHRRRHSTSEERKPKDLKKDKDDSSKHNPKKLTQENVDKDRTKVEIEDNKDIIINRITESEKEPIGSVKQENVCNMPTEEKEESKSGTFAIKSAVQAKSEVKPEVVIDEEYLVQINKNNLKEETRNITEADVSVEFMNPSTFPHTPDKKETPQDEQFPLQESRSDASQDVLKEESSNAEETAEEQNKELKPVNKEEREEEDVLRISTSENAVENRMEEYELKGKETEAINLVEEEEEEDPLKISEADIKEYYYNKEKEEVSDLGILDELKNLKQRECNNGLREITLKNEEEEVTQNTQQLLDTLEEGGSSEVDPAVQKDNELASKLDSAVSIEGKDKTTVDDTETEKEVKVEQTVSRITDDHDHESKAEENPEPSQTLKVVEEINMDKEKPENSDSEKDSANDEVPVKESEENKVEKKSSGGESSDHLKKSKSSNKEGISMKEYIYRSVFQYSCPKEVENPAPEPESPNILVPLSLIPLPGEAIPANNDNVEEPKTSEENFPETAFLPATPNPGSAPHEEMNEDSNEASSNKTESLCSEKENIAPESDMEDVFPEIPSLEVFDEPKVEKEFTAEDKEEKENSDKKIVEERMKSFEVLEENLYLVDRVKNKRSKEAKRMVCDCTLNKEEIASNEMGCGEDCLNRLLMVECGSRCPLKELCMNKKFQQKKYAQVEVFNAEEKGCGVRACEDIQLGTFIMEYMGEVFDTKEFKRRRKEYAKGSSAHFYFMALRPDRLIDATRKGNISRFINHSCSPNAETQKWTVNGDIRIGFFATRNIVAGEEINFDYRLERYGREPQKCYCGTPECRGWLGEPPDQKTKEEKEEDRKKEMRDRQRREGKRSFFEDMDLEDEIEKLTVRGLRNRQDTLNLSRLMVRCEDSDSRLSLLKILESGEEASKRLFLDYHGLKLLWSWMVDISSSHKCIPLKLEILKTLKCLPITNKTQVTDSKVINIVERWSKAESKSEKKDDIETLKESSSDKKMSDGSEDSDTETSEAKDSDPCSSETVSPDDSSQDSNEAPLATQKEEESESPEDASQSPSTPEEEGTKNPAMSVSELASKLLAIWSDLKEAFRIPKKERIEMMKEHEREVDKEYAKYLDKKKDSTGDRTQAFYDRWRYSGDRDKERERRREKWRTRRKEEEDDKGLSKEERRERFAMQVAKEDEEARQRKLQEEMWKLHLERCTLLGHDPYLTPIFDPSGQYYWDPGAKTWQAYIGPNGNLPVPASYGMTQSDSVENVCPNMSLNQLFLPGAFSPLPHTPVSDGEGQVAELPEGDSSITLDPASIPLPGEHPLPKSSPTDTSVVTIPLPGEDVERGNMIETPPLAHPGPVTINLPTKWKMARDGERQIYFYHTKTRHTQWDLPTEDLHQQLMTRYGLNSDSESDLESDSDSSSSSDSEDFSSDEDENEDEESELPLVQKAESVDEKMIRRPKGRKVRSEKLVQERVISPILFEDREAARRERKEAKERAREEARKERWQLLKALRGASASKGEGEAGANSLSEDVLMSPNDNDDDDHLEEQLTKFSRKQKLDSKGHVKGKSKERAATAMADTSDLARKIKDNFRSRMATYIVSVLNPYRKLECKEGRITSNEDFKYLARKLTHFVMVKELKQLPSIDGLDCSESVKHKTKEFVRKYMSKYGNTFKRDPNDTKEY